MNALYGRFYALGGNLDRAEGENNPLKFWHVPYPAPGASDLTETERAHLYIRTQRPTAYRTPKAASRALADETYVQELLAQFEEHDTQQIRTYMAFEENGRFAKLQPIPGSKAIDLEKLVSEPDW